MPLIPLFPTQPPGGAVRYPVTGTMVIGFHAEGTGIEQRFRASDPYVTEVRRLEVVYIHMDREGK